MKSSDKKAGKTPVSSKPAVKQDFVDPLSITDPLSRSVTVDFEGSDPLSLIMKTESSSSVVTGKSGRSDTIKVCIL